MEAGKSMNKRIQRGDTVSFWQGSERFEGQITDSDGHWVTVKVGDRFYDRRIERVTKIK